MSPRLIALLLLTTCGTILVTTNAVGQSTESDADVVEQQVGETAQTETEVVTESVEAAAESSEQAEQVEQAAQQAEAAAEEVTEQAEAATEEAKTAAEEVTEQAEAATEEAEAAAEQVTEQTEAATEEAEAAAEQVTEQAEAATEEAEAAAEEVTEQAEAATEEAEAAAEEVTEQAEATTEETEAATEEVTEQAEAATEEAEAAAEEVTEQAEATTEETEAVAGDGASDIDAKIAACAACHGADGNSVIPENPKLAGQVPGFIADQLAKFKSGERDNAIMTAQVANLTEEDMIAIDAFYAAQEPQLGAVSEDMQETALIGQKIYRGGEPSMSISACMSCHGPSGKGIPIRFPRVSGQHAQYLESQLLAYKKGTRVSDVMNPIAFRLSEQQIKALAIYMHGLK